MVISILVMAAPAVVRLTVAGPALASRPCAHNAAMESSAGPRNAMIRTCSSMTAAARHAPSKLGTSAGMIHLRFVNDAMMASSRGRKTVMMAIRLPVMAVRPRARSNWAGFATPVGLPLVLSVVMDL